MARLSWLAIPAALIIAAGIWWSAEVLLQPDEPTLGPAVVITPTGTPSPDSGTTAPTDPPSSTPPRDGASTVPPAPPPDAGDDDDDDGDDDDSDDDD
ncbi:hypothetical protein [Paramicrobacterium fandaimingii]|uniref:hypothetical protein n=1 Tax=Paramicrobacterium fandaimingii TaxID=2708079 RepID=UPI001AB021D6|nr:hypothetical protein [Microbacterium fandaimingii]